MHTTNYFNAFITVADDCPVVVAEVPPQKTEKTVANIQFEMINKAPYKYTSDEVLFIVYLIQNNIQVTDREIQKQQFFSKGKACLRSSPLSKRYGWGVHFDAESKIALYAVESDEYRKLSQNQNFKVLKAMRSKK